MKIYYAPDFDFECQSHLLNVKESVSGEMLLGPQGLLSFLEQRLGLTGRYDQSYLRIEQYRQALIENAKGTFFKDSLGSDADATAEHLLNIRDELKASGFSFDIKDAPRRILDICKIEEKVQLFVGFADRWDKVVRGMNPVSVLESIELCLPEELFSPKEKRMLAALEDAGVKINAPTPVETTAKNGSDLHTIQEILLGKDNSKNKVRLKGDGSFCILKAHDILELSRTLAKLYKHGEFQGDILVSNETTILAEGWGQEGLPSFCDYEASSMRPTIQLLKVISNFLWEPLDPEAMISFFALPIKPFPASLAKPLQRAVCNYPGIGNEDWNEVISKWEKDRDSKEVEKGKKWLDEWFYSKRFDQGLGAPAARVIEVFQKIKKYLDGVSDLENNEERKSEIKAVSSASEKLVQIIQMRYRKNDFVKKIDMDKIVIRVLPQTSMGLLKEELGRPRHYSSALAVKDEVEKMCCFGFSENGLGKGSMWTESEQSWLRENGIIIDGPSERFERERWAIVNALSKVKKQLVLGVCDMQGGQRTAMHPVLCDIEAKVENLSIVKEVIDFSKIKQSKKRIQLPGSVNQWNLKHKKLLNDREKESFSSLESLFYYPFIWVMRYKAKIVPGGIESLPNVFTVSGNIVHHMFELFLEENKDPSKVDQKKIESWHKNNFNNLIHEQGAIFLKRGREGELAQLRDASLKSMHDLISHLADNGWKVKETEAEVKGEICKVPLGGNVDILLERGDELAVVDVKYAGFTKRRDQVSNDEDLQLALYSKMAKDMKGFAHAGFYIIIERILHAKNKTAFKNAMTPGSRDHVSSYADIWAKMEETYNNRMGELQNGEVNVQMGILSAGEAKAPPYDGVNALKLRKSPNSYNDYVSLAGWEDEE